MAAVRCPPPAGPPVGLSCRSVLPASWSRLSPSALSAHSYLERPEPADAAAAMAPPRGRAGTVYGWAAINLWRTPGLEACRCRAELEILQVPALPDVPTWRPRYRTWESHKPWGFVLSAPEYIFICNIAPIRKKGSVFKWGTLKPEVVAHSYNHSSTRELEAKRTRSSRSASTT